jgi:hypothetical protein
MVRKAQLRRACQEKSAVLHNNLREPASKFLALARIDHSHSVEMI